MVRILLGTILILFSIYTGWVVWQFGYTSVFEVTLREHPSTQVLIDLFITGGLLFVVMVLDHQRSGRSLSKFVPFAIVTILAGSIGPLLYFIVYPDLFKSSSRKHPRNLT